MDVGSCGDRMLCNWSNPCNEEGFCGILDGCEIFKISAKLAIFT